MTGYNAPILYNEEGMPYNGTAPIPAFLMPMGSPGGYGLGCASSYDAFLATRGASDLLMPLPFAKIDWNRTVDGTSTASVDVGGVQGDAWVDCCAALAEYDPWEVELAIFRDRRRVWAGPVTSMPWSDDGEMVTVNASDLSAWLQRRKFHRDHHDTDLDVCQVAWHYINDALSVDDSMGLVTRVLNEGEAITRSVIHDEEKIVGGELDELAKGMIDWCVIDREMLIADGAIPTGRKVTLTDSHFTEVNTDVDGDNLVTRQTITGQGTGSDGPAVKAEVTASRAERRYGVHEHVESSDIVTTESQATRAARSRLDLYGAPVVSFAGGDIDPEFPLTVDELVPGITFDVAIVDPCRPILGVYRLKSVTAQVDPDTEGFSIEIEPVGYEETS